MAEIAEVGPASISKGAAWSHDLPREDSEPRGLFSLSFSRAYNYSSVVLPKGAPDARVLSDRTRNASRPFSCSVCSSRFVLRPADLQIHQRTHTGERPFICKCGASFLTNSNLRRHQTMHPSGELPSEIMSSTSHGSPSPSTAVLPSIKREVAVFPHPESLPFVDRPSEVQRIMKFPYLHGLFVLLKQSLTEVQDYKSDDPKTWPYSKLEAWLAETRDDIPDTEWVEKICLCVSKRAGKSVWESVQRALGIPLDFLDRRAAQ